MPLWFPPQVGATIKDIFRMSRELVHEHSARLAFVEARGCRPYDVLLSRSQFALTCLTCGREDQVQVRREQISVPAEPVVWRRSQVLVSRLSCSPSIRLVRYPFPWRTSTCGCISWWSEDKEASKGERHFIDARAAVA